MPSTRSALIMPAMLTMENTTRMPNPVRPSPAKGGAPLGCEAMGGCERLFGAGGFWRPREMEA